MARNFRAVEPIGTVAGPWEVSFAAGGGGPDQPIVFAKLDDWSQRQEASIRFYSGIATYRTSFDLPVTKPAALLLDLGTVHNLARVRVNGRDLGVVWCAPGVST